MKCSKSIDSKQMCLDFKSYGNLDLVEDVMKIGLKKLMDTTKNVNKVNFSFWIFTVNVKLLKIST